MFPSWQDICKKYRCTVAIVGNGASIAVGGPSFRWDVLRQQVEEKGVLHRLFHELKTSDFEVVLRELTAFARGPVARALELDHHGSEFYEVVQKQLAQAILQVHPRQRHIGPKKLTAYGDWLLGFGRVFCLNYDLISYWALLRAGIGKFIDGFVDGEYVHSAMDNGRKLKIHYIHGAFFLTDHEYTGAKKIQRKGNLLDELESQWQDQFPLIIAEGDWRDKQSRIDNNDYLHDCFTRLAKVRGPVAIFGCSVAERDMHLWNVLPTDAPILISTTSSTRDGWMDEVEARLSRKVVWFDAFSVPFAS